MSIWNIWMLSFGQAQNFLVGNPEILRYSLCFPLGPWTEYSCLRFVSVVIHFTNCNNRLKWISNWLWHPLKPQFLWKYSLGINELFYCCPKETGSFLFLDTGFIIFPQLGFLLNFPSFMVLKMCINYNFISHINFCCL
jgi:hypothetical protein